MEHLKRLLKIAGVVGREWSLAARTIFVLPFHHHLFRHSVFEENDGGKTDVTVVRWKVDKHQEASNPGLIAISAQRRRAVSPVVLVVPTSHALENMLLNPPPPLIPLAVGAVGRAPIAEGRTDIPGEDDTAATSALKKLWLDGTNRGSLAGRVASAWALLSHDDSALSREPKLMSKFVELSSDPRVFEKSSMTNDVQNTGTYPFCTIDVTFPRQLFWGGVTHDEDGGTLCFLGENLHATTEGVRGVSRSAIGGSQRCIW